ncbi:MAG TPA: apolipoprotein N-acyltransferase [Thermoanaerobaculia bacterium]|nr:apolipoprotein N-acyltransferase [Thermoanaerobaculia bacterium]HQN07203.1 apolipoprotein N-acyltransferase [Thermoanaerobaculia bacterium]HQP85788.1 apolipoprotein N-acyltransferase [Thermoanaerobaculia bacterium]
MEVFSGSLRARAAAALVSGLLLGLTFPNASLVVFLPVAIVPFALALDGASPGRGALLGGLFGVAFWLTTFPWIYHVVHRFGGLSAPLASLALLIAACIPSVAFAAMGWAAALAAPRTAAARLLVLPAAWVAQELLRTYAFSGFPWALVSYPLAPWPVLTQAAALGGAALVSFLVVLVNAALAEAMRERGRGRLAGAAVAGSVLLAAITFGSWRLGRPEASVGGRSLRVLIVQPNVAQDVRFAPGAAERIHFDVTGLTRALLRKAPADLVLWPESATPFAWPWSEGLREDLTRLCREERTALLFNTVWSDAPLDDTAAYFNSALLVDGDGVVGEPYHKLRLVPFGEYVPAPSLFGWVNQVSQEAPGAFTPGSRALPLERGGIRLGGAICYEVVYPWIARAQVAAGADALYTLTNDAWYGDGGAQEQHWQAAVFRAVETGRPLLRAAVTGVSGWVDARGRTLARLGPGARAGIAGTLRVPPRGGATLATRLGDAPALVCAAALLVAILRARASVRRAPPHV